MKEVFQVKTTLRFQFEGKNLSSDSVEVSEVGCVLFRGFENKTQPVELGEKEYLRLGVKATKRLKFEGVRRVRKV